MAFSFDEVLTRETKFEGSLAHKKILLYACNNTGKTYQATRMSDKTFLIATEAGYGAVTCPVEPCDDWKHFKEIVADLTSPKTLEQRLSQIEVVVIDTLENLVAQSERAICNKFGVSDLSEITGRQNGYKMARTDFEMQINKLCSKGYCVIFIAHEEKIEVTDEVTGETYQFIQPKGTSNEKSSCRQVRDVADYTIYLKPNPCDRETFQEVHSTAILTRTKGVFARSRFKIVPVIQDFTASALRKAIEDSVINSAEEEGVTVTDFFTAQAEKHVDTKEDYFEIIKPYIEKLFPLCGDEVLNIVATYLGEGRKVTDATDDELVALSNIYNDLVTKATLLGVEV